MRIRKNYFFIIPLCLLVVATALADMRWQPLYLRMTSYPRHAGVVFVEEHVVNQYEYHVSKSFSFNSVEESDTDMIEMKMVKYAATGGAQYEAHAKPNDGFFFLGFTQSDYIGPRWQDFGIHGEDEYFEYYAPDDDKWDTCFVFNDRIYNSSYKKSPRKIQYDLSHGPMYFNDTWDHIGVFPKEDDQLIESYPFIFTSTPSEYCWALFARVIVKDGNGGTAKIANHSDEQSDITNDIGDEICITAVTSDKDITFQYWIEESTGRHITENPYTFTVTHQDTYTPHFGPSPEGIESPEADASARDASAIYTLDGKALKSEPQKGVFIKGNRKMIKR